MMMTLWPRGFGELISSPLSLILTVVSVDARPRSYLFSSATVRMPVYTAQKCGTEPIRYSRLHSVTEIVLKPWGRGWCEQKPHLVYGCRAGVRVWAWAQLCSQKPNRKVGLLFTHIRMVIDFNDEPYTKKRNHGARLKWGRGEVIRTRRGEHTRGV